MFWDGTKWVPERPQKAPRRDWEGPRRSLKDWLATVPILLLIPALLSPFLSAGATTPTLTYAGEPVAGGRLSVSATGFVPRERIQLLWDGVAADMPVVRVSSRSTFTAAVSIPATASTGEHLLSAVAAAKKGAKGESSGTGAAPPETIASVTVTVTASPTPTPTASPAPSPTAEPTPSATPTPAPSPTPTATPTPTPTGTPEPSSSPTAEPTPSASPSAAPSPTPTVSPPATREPYGMAIEMDGLGNWQVGGPNGQPDRLVAYRFRATTSSALASIQVAFPNMNPGYAAGTGGTLEISLRSDDGTAGHFPSGTILAKTSIRPGEIIPTTNWPRIAFPTPAQLTAGTLYHIVFRNTDPDPAANFVSVDDIHLNPPFGSPIQPKYANVDWALVYRPTAGADWLYQTDYAPILGLHYANGHVAGTAYVYSDLGSPKPISGSSKVRETFTVSGADRTVSSVGVRLKWISGTSPLTVRLETSGGSEIETVTIPAAALTTSGYAVRATATFAAPRTLAAGQTYHLVLSSSGSYRAFAPYEGSAYGKWDPRTYFADGHAQSTTGAGWLDWGGRTDHDLQFYLE